MNFLRVLKSLFTLPVALLRWFYSTTIVSENQGNPLPPIRYDGDPTDIYLA